MKISKSFGVLVYLAALLCSGYCSHLCATGSQAGSCYTFTVTYGFYASHISTRAISGYLYTPGLHNGCSAIRSPPDSNNLWFVLLDEYDICPLDKVYNARNAGYQLLFTYSHDTNYRTVTSEVSATGYPVIVLTAQCAAELNTRGAVTIGEVPTVQVKVQRTLGANGDLVYVTVCSGSNTNDGGTGGGGNGNSNTNDDDDEGGTGVTVGSVLGGFFGVLTFIGCVILCVIMGINFV